MTIAEQLIKIVLPEKKETKGVERNGYTLEQSHEFEMQCFYRGFNQCRAIMNKHFVSIKIDREERPDIDTVKLSCLIYKELQSRNMYSKYIEHYGKAIADQLAQAISKADILKGGKDG